jgi:23S rRNA (guanosine2251-2'-O)-methyltransferase
MKNNKSRPFKKNSSQGSSQSSGRSAGGRRSSNNNLATRSDSQISRDWRVVVGNHAIKEALSVSSKKVKMLWLKNSWETSADLREIEEFARARKIKIELKQDPVIDKFGSSHQGAALFVDGAPAFNTKKIEKQDKSIILMLDGIEDPHNLGAIMRTSWLTNVHGVLIPGDRAVGLTPTVHKVACGGVEHVPVVETSNFTQHAEDLKKMGYWVYGLSPRGKRSIFELDLPEKVIWAIGAEDKGLRVTTERLCDELAFIPQASEAASYNASVATAMALTETMRQHAAQGNQKKIHSKE